jgi:Protein of unknown function (DUF3617)
MRRALFTLACCSILFTLIASAQARKAGLWEMTTSMDFKQSPFPQQPAQVNGHPVPQMQGANGSGSPFGGPHTIQLCVTQAYLDKYNAIVSTNSPQQRECQVTNISKTANGMTATMACTGRMSGTGSMQSSWTDSEHASGSVHFTGTMQLGPNPANTRPVEWTSTTNSVFKSTDCGSVKPLDVTPPATAPAPTK